MNLYFNKEEIYYLLDLLESELTELKTEIHHSANHSFKEDLKAKMKFLNVLISKVSLLGPDKIREEKPRESELT